MSKTLSVILAIVLTAVIVFGLTFGFMYLKNRALSEELVIAKNGLGNNRKLNEIGYLIDQVYVGDVDSAYMTEQLSAAMIKGIDDEWSYYMNADQYADYIDNVTNSYVGVGITIRLIEESDPGFTITETVPGGPADQAGVQAGDLLIAVEGQSAVELGTDGTKNLVRGEEGTDVTLTIRTDGEDRDVTMTRAKVKSVNVTYEMLEGNIGYVHIRNFEQNAAKDAITAIAALKKQGMTGLVFDVRFNPGGRKTELVQLLDYLLPEGVIFHSELYNGQEEFDRSDEAHLDLPMSVLVNLDSYSAAEFFAAALQEYDAADVVGTQTYGKGYFQQCIPLSDGSAVNISTGKYYTPNGKSLAGVGITPDHVIEISDEEYYAIYFGEMAHEDDVQLQEAIKAVSSK